MHSSSKIKGQLHLFRINGIGLGSAARYKLGLQRKHRQSRGQMNNLRVIYEKKTQRNSWISLWEGHRPESSALPFVSSHDRFYERHLASSTAFMLTESVLRA